MTGSELLKRLALYDPAPTDYFRHGADRIAKTLAFVPEGDGKLLELGCDSHFSLALSLVTRYEVVPQNSPRPIAAPENIDDPVVTFSGPDTRQFRREIFDVERARFPFEDDSFEGVLCCELIEHLFHDPAWMLREVNRVLRPGGFLLLTTPNLTSYHAIRRAAQGIHPLEHSMYFSQDAYPGLPIQHTREYTFYEIVDLCQAMGFRVERQATYAFTKHEQLGLAEIAVLLPAILLYNVFKGRHPKHLMWWVRRPHTFVLVRKVGVPSQRSPVGLYYQ